MKKWFNTQNRLVQLILLLIPFVNWIIELVIRWEVYTKKKDLFHLILALIVTIFGLVWGWIDFIVVLVVGHLTFAK